MFHFIFRLYIIFFFVVLLLIFRLPITFLNFFASHGAFSYLKPWRLGEKEKEKKIFFLFFLKKYLFNKLFTKNNIEIYIALMNFQYLKNYIDDPYCCTVVTQKKRGKKNNLIDARERKNLSCFAVFYIFLIKNPIRYY